MWLDFRKSDLYEREKTQQFESTTRVAMVENEIL